MSQSLLDCPGPGFVFVEGEYGGEWVDERVRSKVYNPYSVAGKISRAKKPIQGLPDKNGLAWGRDYNRAKRSAPDERGYSWSMGYNNLVGRYTQGNLFPDLSGSSINRKKYAKVIPAKDEDIIALADQAASEFNLVSRTNLVEWEGCRYNASIVAQTVRDHIDAGNRELAFGLALRLSASFRELSRGLSIPLHVLSTRSRGKIKDKATAFFRSSPGNRVFATLTFIAGVEDRQAAAILNKFLTQARKKFPGLQYFWVAERQTKTTGNIHFHMILNKRLPVGRWNAMWVLAQYNAGLVGKNQWGDEISKEEIHQLYAWDLKENFSGGRSKKGKKISRIQEVLNPFDIRPVKSIGSLSGYLTKYITKQEKNQPFGCAAWHCSRRVSRMFTRQTVGPSAFAYMKSFANYGVDKSTGEVHSEPKEILCGNGFAVLVYACDKAAPLRYLKKMEQVNKWILEGHEVDRVPMLDDELFRKHYICRN